MYRTKYLKLNINLLQQELTYVVSRNSLCTLKFQKQGYDSILGSARKSPTWRRFWPFGSWKRNMTEPGQLKRKESLLSKKTIIESGKLKNIPCKQRLFMTAGLSIIRWNNSQYSYFDIQHVARIQSNNELQVIKYHDTIFFTPNETQNLLL